MIEIVNEQPLMFDILVIGIVDVWCILAKACHTYNFSSHLPSLAMTKGWKGLNIWFQRLSMK